MIAAIFGVYAAGLGISFLGQMMYSGIEQSEMLLVHIVARSLFWPLALSIFLFRCLMWIVSQDNRWLE